MILCHGSAINRDRSLLALLGPNEELWDFILVSACIKVKVRAPDHLIYGPTKHHLDYTFTRIYQQMTEKTDSDATCFFQSVSFFHGHFLNVSLKWFFPILFLSCGNFKKVSCITSLSQTFLQICRDQIYLVLRFPNKAFSHRVVLRLYYLKVLKAVGTTMITTVACKYRILSPKGPWAVNCDFKKVWRWAVGRTLNKEGKKIQIFQSLAVGDNAGMGHSVVKYSTTMNTFI